MERMHLFLIKKASQDQYWSRSVEHGSGWHLHYPKQSFSKSELGREVAYLAGEGLGKQRIEIIELHA